MGRGRTAQPLRIECGRYQGLTAREALVVEMAAQGWGAQDIARWLGVRRATVDTYAMRIRKKRVAGSKH